ncbi:MAG: hypothetical protein ACYS47_08395 [Planctomycetota bacterium]
MEKAAKEGGDDADGSGGDPGPLDSEAHTTDAVKVIRDLQERLDYAYSIREALESDIEGANAKLSGLIGENDELRKRIDFLETRDKLAAQLQSELEFLQDEKSDSVRTIHTLESRVSDLDAQKSALEKEVSSVHGSLAEMKKKAVELQTEVIRRRDHAATLENISTTLDETKAKLAQATERVSSLEAQLDTSSIAKDSVDLDLERMKQVSRGLRREIEALQSARETLEKEKRALRSKLLASEYENKRLGDRMATLDLRLSEALRDKGDIRGELQAARQSLIDVQDALESSREKLKKRWSPGPQAK